MHITTTQKNCLKRNVLIDFLEISIDSVVCNCNGSLFHKCGAAAWNAYPPRVASNLPLGGSSKIPELDLRLYEDFPFNS